MDTLMKAFDDWAIDQGMCIEKWQHPAEGYPYSDYDTQKAFEGFRAGWNKRTSEWVSVEDRLPEKLDEYIVWRENSGFGVSFFSPDIKVWHFPHVTHWMPLPQPPKGDE